MRTFYRATGGIDGAIQTLLFWAVILTAPIWVPVVALVILYEAFFPKKYEPAKPPEHPVCQPYRNLAAQGVEGAKARLVEYGCRP